MWSWQTVSQSPPEGRGTNRQELGIDEIKRLIREAGCIPVERDSLYRAVLRDASGAVTRGTDGGVITPDFIVTHVGL